MAPLRGFLSRLLVRLVSARAGGGGHGIRHAVDGHIQLHCDAHRARLSLRVRPRHAGGRWFVRLVFEAQVWHATGLNTLHGDLALVGPSLSIGIDR